MRELMEFVAVEFFAIDALALDSNRPSQLSFGCSVTADGTPVGENYEKM